MNDPTPTALAVKALLGRIDNSAYRGIIRNRAVLGGWAAARSAGLWDSHVCDAVVDGALDALWGLLHAWADEVPVNPWIPDAQDGLPPETFPSWRAQEIARRGERP